MSAMDLTLERPQLESNELLLTNARIVTEKEVFTGTLKVRNGLISTLERGNTSITGALDCQGAYLIPGLVELHTDNLEKHFSPRPGVIWPSHPAVLTHDAHIVSSGITTVFDALSVGDVVDDSNRLAHLRTLIDALAETRKAGMLRSDHLLHLRCEVSFGETLQLFEGLADHSLLQLVSVMDHTPGQRQFVREDKYRQYYQGKHGLSDSEMDTFTRKRKESALLHSDRNRKAIVAICQARGIPLASHDDATLDHVTESAEFGMRIAEFPTTLEAAKASHDHGLRVLMGAPNIVRGGSHSGNIAAADLAAAGVLDILSSDYYPASMLDAAFRLAAMEDNSYDLARAIATVTATPARSANLHDRGLIAPGKRADLVLVEPRGQLPVIHNVWRSGERVY
ncbi:alpha-D-ribose 1-methylphosphonate 5-triphosphate diphosphatase [Marinobacter sp. TBZ242]|uniref:Alpha-D-ribose 1-methylphosphonate 5-triphosphate diphosphatase n=1 Tax=Marinobacter azerbaijanicus TaxID=3050455 RepID=A0ABT7IC09_9GAMM|nr:alpha-D-ribose 1-methylphosphonate 5-triphosphate diphosphatase [Marinobacter sp. TBZ242]MDL0431686.1 alpha-D-ribose 1-methylphosphonate 5-triphosphate diphosphatase [Marinobacter sp. TBZ242]